MQQITHGDNRFKNQRNTDTEKNFFKIIGIILLCVLCIILMFSSYKLYRKYTKARHALTDTRLELSKFQDQEKKITESIDRLSHTEGLEYEIREKYRVVKPGEQLIVVIDNVLQNTTPRTPGFFEKIKEYLY